MTRELKLQDSRVSGKASQPNETERMFPAGFDVRFDVALLRAKESGPATVSKKPGRAANVKPSVTGVFKGNGKEAKRARVSAHQRDPGRYLPRNLACKSARCRSSSAWHRGLHSELGIELVTVHSWFKMHRGKVLSHIQQADKVIAVIK